MEINESYMLNLTISQIRVLHLALEKYIRNHDIILTEGLCPFDRRRLFV